MNSNVDGIILTGTSIANNSAEHSTEPVDWSIVMNEWPENQPITLECYMHDISDYIPIGLLSMLGNIQSQPDYKALESGLRLFEQSVEELSASMHYFHRYLDDYPSEGVVVKINHGDKPCKLPENITCIDQFCELYDIRGKVSVLDNCSKPIANIQVCNSENWNSIHNFLQTHGDFENCHDANIPIKITVSSSAESTSKIHTLITENSKLVSVGWVLLPQEADIQFTKDVIKINTKWKHLIRCIIKSDKRVSNNYCM